MIGSIKIKSFDKNNYNHDIVCSKSSVACLKFNNEGTLLATASEKVFIQYNFIKGTIVRIFRVSDKTLLHEVRRGQYSSNIYDISFNNTSNMISCISDHGTVHIFSLEAKKYSMYN